MSTAFLKREREQLAYLNDEGYDSDTTELESPVHKATTGNEAPTWSLDDLIEGDKYCTLLYYIDRIQSERAQNHMWFEYHLRGLDGMLQWLPRATLEPVIEEYKENMSVWRYRYKRELGWE